mmetsp:Transcript_2212/g.3685  ORF Transcript_2212/g.3685 Transcript_2212/m.3685 type:complete len:412 (+) Transcript_2212:136-1371(+)
MAAPKADVSTASRFVEAVVACERSGLIEAKELWQLQKVSHAVRASLSLAQVSIDLSLIWHNARRKVSFQNLAWLQQNIAPASACTTSTVEKEQCRTREGGFGLQPVNWTPVGLALFMKKDRLNDVFQYLGEDRCKQLRRLFLREVCQSSLNPPTVFQFSRLRSLHVLGADSLTSLQNLGGFPVLTTLSLSNCPRLRSLRGLEYSPALKDLELIELSELNDVDALKECSKLVDLRLISLQNLCPSQLQALPKTTLTVSIVNCSGFDELAEEFWRAEGLRELRMGFLPLLHLDSLNQANVLQVLHLASLRIENLYFLGKMPLLREIRLEFLDLLESLEGLERCPLLEVLCFSSCSQLSDLQALDALEHVVDFSLEYCACRSLPVSVRLWKLSRLVLKPDHLHWDSDIHLTIPL